MENLPHHRRIVLVISLRAELLSGGQTAWRGTIRTDNGLRRNFSILADLNQMLCDLSGWQTNENLTDSQSQVRDSDS